MTTMTTSYAPEVVADASGTWCGNALRFATEAEAWTYVRDLERRWMLVTNIRVVPSADPVNYAIIDGTLMTVSAS
jgi:hypothetical protein